jgi:hypothetical protein
MVEAQIFSVPISFTPFEDRLLARMSGLSVGTYGLTTTGQTCSRLHIVSGSRFGLLLERTLFDKQRTIGFVMHQKSLSSGRQTFPS